MIPEHERFAELRVQLEQQANQLTSAVAAIVADPADQDKLVAARAACKDLIITLEELGIED